MHLLLDNDNTQIALAMIYFEIVLSGLVELAVHQRKHQDLLETGAFCAPLTKIKQSENKSWRIVCFTLFYYKTSVWAQILDQNGTNISKLWNGKVGILSVDTLIGR